MNNIIPKIIGSQSDVMQKGSGLFRVFLKLEGLELLIVGGGNQCIKILEEAIQNLPATKIRIVATHINDEIKDLVAYNNKILLIERPYRTTDIDDANMVITATNDIETNVQISRDAKAKGVLLRVPGKSDLSGFYLVPIIPNDNGNLLESGNNKLPIDGKNLYSKRKDRSDKNAILEEADKPAQKHWKKIAAYSSAAFACMLIGHFIFSYIPFKDISAHAINLYRTLDANFIWMVVAGFVAQLVDGALGMGYGVTSASILLSTGINPAAISGSIHTAEMFASGASGYSHYKFGNVNKRMFKIMVIPVLLVLLVAQCY